LTGSRRAEDSTLLLLPPPPLLLGLLLLLLLLLSAREHARTARRRLATTCSGADSCGRDDGLDGLDGVVTPSEGIDDRKSLTPSPGMGLSTEGVSRSASWTVQF